MTKYYYGCHQEMEYIKHIINREPNLFALRINYDDHLKVFRVKPDKNDLVCTVRKCGKQIAVEYDDKYILADWKTKIRRYYSVKTMMDGIKEAIIKTLIGENNMEKFTLNTNFIPALNRNGIRFRYIGGIYDPMTIIITHKNLDICRVDVNRDSNEPYNYNVYWFASTVKNASCLSRRYSIFQDLIDDIRAVIDFNFKQNNENKGEDKMNNKMYRVSDMSVITSSVSQDEITLTVKPLRSRGMGFTDCDKIKEAIESIKIHEDSIDALSYCKADIISTYELMQMFGKTSIQDVIFNNPATIVLWADGTKTVVKAENEPFDPEKGLAMAIAKKALGNDYGYYDVFKKYVGKYEKKQKKGGK